MMTPAAFRDRFGVDTPGPVETPHFAGFGIAVNNLDDTRRLLNAAGVEGHDTAGSIQLSSALSGIVVEFTE